MEIKGRRVSQGCKIHLFIEQSHKKWYWYSRCGQRVPPQHALPLEAADKDSCCAVCWNRYHHALQAAKAKPNPKC